MDRLDGTEYADTSRDNVYYYLMPWARWLDRRKCKPTDQLLKEHLIERDLVTSSYHKIGDWCVKFCNYYLG